MNIGEWVKHRGTSRIGMIKKHNKENNEFFVTWHWDKGSRITGTSVSWVGPSALVPAPVELTNDDYKMLIDLALDTKDFTWIKLLTRKAKLSTNC